MFAVVHPHCMQISSLSDIKKELQSRSQEELLALTLRLAKYKKENKELLHYLLFESTDEDLYINRVKEETDLLFSEIHSRNYYIAKKGIRKILRIINKYIRYSGEATTAIELLIHFCKGLNALGMDYRGSTALMNLYEGQIKKIRKSISTLHEDLQYDYEKEMKRELGS